MLWFTYELWRRLPPRPITANAVCPGFVPTTAAASTHGAMHVVMTHLLPHKPFATSVDAAHESLAFMALDPSLDGAVLGSMDVHLVRAADRPAAACGARRRVRDDRSTAIRPLRPALDAVVPAPQRGRRPGHDRLTPDSLVGGVET